MGNYVSYVYTPDTDTVLVTGFIGAGKTTMLSQLGLGEVGPYFFGPVVLFEQVYSENRIVRNVLV